MGRFRKLFTLLFLFGLLSETLLLRAQSLTTVRDTVKNADGSVIPWLTTKQVPVLIADSVVGGGMLPKLEACSTALRRGVGRVRILPAAQAEVLPQFYFQKLEYGTEVIGA